MRKNGAFTCLRILSVGGSKVVAQVADAFGSSSEGIRFLSAPSARNEEKARFQCEKLLKRAFLAPKTCKKAKKGICLSKRMKKRQ